MGSIEHTVGEVRDQLLGFAQDLVRIESYSGREERIVRFIAGRIGSGGRTVMLDSHIDTVEVLDADEWAYPPFGGAIIDGSLWGRGSVDMKSGGVASVYAAAWRRPRARRPGQRRAARPCPDPVEC